MCWPRGEFVVTIPLFGVVQNAAIEQVATEVLRSGMIASGPYVEKFTRAFGRLIGQSHVVTTNDMSSAMTIALRLAGVTPADEVITSPFSCMSTNAPIGASGATTVWADLDPATASLSVESVQALLTPRTRAVVLYHVAGYPGPSRAIADLCRAAGVALIEDCDNALGAEVDGGRVGDFGDFGIYSFYPNRQINGIDGGALSCRTAADFARASRLRRYGIDSSRFRDARGEIDPNCDVKELGYSASFNNLNSAIAYVQLNGLAARQARTVANANALTTGLTGLAGLKLVAPLAGACPVYWTLLTLVNHRDAVLERLKDAGIAVSRLHYRTDHYSGFRARSGSLVGVETFMAETLSLPCGWWLDDSEIDQIIDAVRDAVTAVH